MVMFGICHHFQKRRTSEAAVVAPLVQHGLRQKSATPFGGNARWVGVRVTTIESINRFNRLLSIRLIQSISVYKIDYNLGFQMTHIEVKSLEKRLRYELKYN